MLQRFEVWFSAVELLLRGAVCPQPQVIPVAYRV